MKNETVKKVFCQNCQADILIKEHCCSNCTDQLCVKCGCTDSEPCAESCDWITPGVCSSCIGNSPEDKVFLLDYVLTIPIETDEDLQRLGNIFYK